MTHRLIVRRLIRLVIAALTLSVVVTARASEAPPLQFMLEADLFGTHLAATWVTQLASARLVREVTLEQPADGRVRVRIVPADQPWIALHSST